MSPRDEADKNQKRAADPAASVFVTANAGSGKTKVLVDRIARLLLAGGEPSRFLCITYTKAAAAEMQRRLFDRLGGWCVASDDVLSEQLSKLAEDHAPSPSPEQLARARALFARALETPGGLKIQTIHAFCERLLARFPLEAGVAPGFDIADEVRAAAALARARAQAALNASAEEAAAFERFAARLHGEGLEALMDRLAMQRAALLRFAKNKGGAEAALSYLRARHDVRSDRETLVAQTLSAAPWRRLEEAHGLLSASSANDVKAGARIKAAMLAREGPRALEALFSVAFKADGDPYAKPVTKALSDKHPWLADLFADLIDALSSAREALNAIDRFEDARAALLLGLRLEQAYEAAKARAGMLDFDDLIAHAHALLTRADSAPWILYKLDGGLDHILIDEGQDTSPAQWDLTAPLQDEFFSGAGARDLTRTVFAVGDPKQSIYAFQGADPVRFLAESQALSVRAVRAGKTFVGRTLETSFRSTPEVLSAVDAVFAERPLAPGEPEASNIIRHLAAREHEHGLVEVWPLAPRPEAQKAEAWDAPLDVETGMSAQAVLAREIARHARAAIDAREGVWENKKLRPMHAGDILVLVRKRSVLFRELIKAFKREGLAVAGADRISLKDELAVEDCLALMRCALDPYDDLNLACVLKGPWCNLIDDDADLFPLAADRIQDESLYARLLREEGEKYQEARAFVSALAERAGEDAFQFLSWALETLDAQGRSGWTRVFARLGPEARDALEELQARALSQGSHAAPSLQRFVYDIETSAGEVKREMEGAGEAVRVMTVHGAKGLEAPVVYLPDAASGPGGSDALLMTPDGPFLSAGSKSDDAATRAAKEAAREAASGEHWRLLYVAMTRARDRLIVCGAQMGNASDGEAAEGWRRAVEQALAPLAAPCETPFGQGLLLGQSTKAEASATIEPVLTALPDWIDKPAKTQTPLASLAPSRLKAPDVFSPIGAGQDRFKRGRLVHGLLQRLPEVAPARRGAAALSWLTRQGQDEKTAARLAEEAMAVLNDSRCAAAFAPGSRAEAPIIGEAGGRVVRGIVDRLAVAPDSVLVVDFKTDRPAPPRAEDAPEPYVQQMALYRAVLRQIFPGRAVRCALIWTDGPHLVELPEAQLERVLTELPQI